MKHFWGLLDKGFNIKHLGFALIKLSLVKRKEL